MNIKKSKIIKIGMEDFISNLSKTNTKSNNINKKLIKKRKMEYNIGDIVKTKKQHPCGSKTWEITRVGVDFKLKCQGCDHVVTLPREKALKAITKKILE